MGSAAGSDSIIRLIDVHKKYLKPDGSVLVHALRGVNMAVPRGQYVAIMGASGSGKSTMMNTLGCLDRPSSGRYELDGQPVESMGDDELSGYRGRKIGFVFQNFNLIPQLTVRENVEVPLFYQKIERRQRHKMACEMLEMVELGNRVDHRPMELSGGQQQRAAIARALVTGPAVIMADEPTGNLDSKTGLAVLRLFEKLHEQGRTIIMVTHAPEVAELAQRVVRLKDGEIEYDREQVGRKVEV
jgi:putative ABC transport system ATP-binding protein